MADDGGSSGLEQFCLLAKTAKARACVALVQQVLAEKKIFVFGELLAMPNVQELRGTEHENQLRLLELFAYGTYADYKANQSQLPPVRHAMLDKLRMLTIVSLAQEQRIVNYSQLQQTLEVPNVRALEDLIFDCIYAGLIQGKLDQRAGVLRVRGALARDVRLTDVDAMLQKLEQWAAAAQQARAALQEGAAEARQTRHYDEIAQRALEKKLKDLKRDAAKAANQGGGGRNTTVTRHLTVDKPLVALLLTSSIC
eukprot:4810-Heterococcus_DN1.PRE.1